VDTSLRFGHLGPPVTFDQETFDRQKAAGAVQGIPYHDYEAAREEARTAVICADKPE